MKKFLTIVLSLIFVVGLVGCGETNQTTKYTVKLYDGENLYYQTTVENGRRIEVAIKDPTTTDETMRFTGWYKEAELKNLWVFAKDIITKDTSLYAGWMKVSTDPTNLAVSTEALKSGLTWLQSGVTTSTEVTVKAYPFVSSSVVEEQIVDTYSETPITVVGTITVNGDIVTWTPTTEPNGGKYKVVLTVGTSEEITLEGVWFKGTGSATNPYIIVNGTDLDAITKTTGNVGEGKYYVLGTDFTYETDYNLTKNTTFMGTLDGKEHEVTLSGNSGIFYAIGSKANVLNVVVKGAISTAAWAGIGALTNNNEGYIENVTVYANVTSQVEIVAKPDQKELGGAGGIVGINKVGGTVINSMYTGDSSIGSSVGVIKATNGGGGIAGTNYGTISNCINKGCLGAYNAVESGKSLSAYSFCGGIAGYNYGLIEKSGTESIGKLLAQRALSAETANEFNNIAIGGVVGYNALNATITECHFEGIRVHGDQAVGGIAGINAGTISHSYASGKYYSSTNITAYIGGRLEVGGIAGRIEATSVITNCYVNANVFAYQSSAYAIAEKADNSVANKINNNTNTANSISLSSTPVSNTLVQPIGTGNDVYENVEITEVEVNAKLPETYLNVLGSKFAYSVADETIRLKYQVEDAGNYYTVKFVDGTEEVNSLVVYEVGEEVTAPNYAKEQYKFLGWSLTESGEVLYNVGDALLYSALSLKITEGNEITLYAILEESKDPVPTKELVIGYLTSQNITEEMTNNLKTGFLSYCKANDLEVETVTLVAINASKIADYTAEIAANATIDIVLGVGNNINSNASSVIKDAVNEKIAMNIVGNDGRYAISLVASPNSINAASFLTFLQTEDANKIINPAQRTTNVVIGIFDKYCKADIASSLKTAFETYLTEQGFSVTVTFTTLTSISVSAVVDEIQTASPAIDVVLGGGNNITSTAGATSGTTINASKTSVTISGSARNAATISDCANALNAQSFIDFLALESTAAILNPAA